MRIQRLTPLRGLLAGLLALIVFASCAVAMTAGGSSAATSQLPAQTVRGNDSRIAAADHAVDWHSGHADGDHR